MQKFKSMGGIQLQDKNSCSLNDISLSVADEEFDRMSRLSIISLNNSYESEKVFEKHPKLLAPVIKNDSLAPQKSLDLRSNA